MAHTPASAASGLHGGEWLLQSQPTARLFTPERLTDEHRLVGRTVTAFMNTEVLPATERLEQKDWALARQLMRRCGELGLLGVDVSEADGGAHVDTVMSMLVSERMSRAPSFSATFGAQLNLVILPFSLFGTDAQKRRYLPGLMSGDVIGAYCLSETGSGSDALSARARATRQADGGFVLNGEKMWITNGGIADLFVVFAKVDGEHFSTFIVERGFPGVTSGREEHKMGLHGSSTTPVVLQNVRVPAGNLLGEIGRGHKIAFNVLNFARFKLGATCGGGAVGAIGEAVRYAAERHQFGQPIASFGAIKHKLGEMVVRAYALESLNYRTAGLIDERLAAASADAFDPAAALLAFEEYAVEASISKVAGSETLDFVLDENIQIHGGNGYVHDYPAERHYRDSRVNRIFEGTNEINRLLIPGLLARRANAGQFPMGDASQSAWRDRVPDGPPATVADSVLADETAAVERFKRSTHAILGIAMQAYGQTLAGQQEVLMHLADMLIDVYTADSAVLRARAAASDRLPAASLHTDLARVFVNDAALRIVASARQALATMLEGPELGAGLEGVHRSLGPLPINTTSLRRRIADEALARQGYPLA
jgi:alkylation response protein AidB-like acyl-CoA dehydrogenase